MYPNSYLKGNGSPVCSRCGNASFALEYNTPVCPECFQHPNAIAEKAKKHREMDYREMVSMVLEEEKEEKRWGLIHSTK